MSDLLGCTCTHAASKHNTSGPCRAVCDCVASDRRTSPGRFAGCRVSVPRLTVAGDDERLTRCGQPVTDRDRWLCAHHAAERARLLTGGRR